MTTVTKINLGEKGPLVSKLGLGCMRMSSVVNAKGEHMLKQKNQLAELTKTPVEDNEYQTIIISLQEDLLRKIVLEEQIEIGQKYTRPTIFQLVC